MCSLETLFNDIMIANWKTVDMLCILHAGLTMSLA
jgi:hypothetical protein